jgi:hypothetical protein
MTRRYDPQRYRTGLGVWQVDRASPGGRPRVGSTERI